MAWGAPAEQITVGLIGAGPRGRLLLEAFQRDPTVRIAAVCDIYEPNLEAGLSAARNKPKAYRNHIALLGDREVKAVIIATPEHWHAQMVLDALAGGKDVYVETPVCRTPEEGIALVQAARISQHQSNIIQVGMQRGSAPLYLKARDIRKSGRLGPVWMSRSHWVQGRRPGGAVDKRKLTGPLDWDQWQGPISPRRPQSRATEAFFEWRNLSEYSGGVVADQGAQIYGAVHMIMGLGYPVEVNASAALPQTPGHRPGRVVISAKYAGGFLATFTANDQAMEYAGRFDQLNQFDGEEARLDVGLEHLAIYQRGEYEKPALAESVPFGNALGAHVANFLDCVRSRAQPNTTVELAFQAALVVQLAKLSIEQKRTVRWNVAQNKVES